MKQIIQNFKTGELRVAEVPQPIIRPQGVLVHNHYSLISLGTEGSTVKTAQKSLLGKARERPDLVQQVISLAKREGVLAAYQASMKSLDSALPLGYSCAGTVMDVGSEVTDLKIGDRVACGGGGYANHAEAVYVPRNLCVRLSEEVSFKSGAFVTAGAIAMHGVRIADVRLGETVAIIGQGLIGLLTLQILKAAGCRVIGIDLNPQKVKLAKQLGADDAIARQDPTLVGRVNKHTNGVGVDAVIITAATQSNDPVELGGEISRHRGRVIVVGRVNMNIPRETYFYKELQFFTSLSYGPGRYDSNYEEKGIDYPISYVRWTENRNMQAFTELLRSGDVQTDPLITHEFPIDKAEKAYGIVTGQKSTNREPIAVLLEYDPEREINTPRISLQDKTYRPSSEQIYIGLIGAGNFARNTLLPILSKMPDVKLSAIATASGFNARVVGEKYGFQYCAETAEEIIQDTDIDAVMIFTRHDSHGPLVAAALEVGKAIYVEKPLAVNADHLEQVVSAWTATQGKGRVMVGFNRRFAPLAQKLKLFFAEHSQPMVITYRVNAGFQPRSKWIHDPLEGGGRIVGEGCHFVDFMQFLTGAKPISVWSQSIGDTERQDIINEDNVVINISFDDGSLGNLIYVANGDKSFSKERVEVFSNGSTGILEDFRLLRLVRNGRTKKFKHWLKQDKGHKAEMQLFISALKEGKNLPVSFEDHVLTTQVTFDALASQKSGAKVDIFPNDNQLG